LPDARAGAGVKFNAHRVNRFALKRPFAVEIIHWCAAQSRGAGGRGEDAAALNRFATAFS